MLMIALSSITPSSYTPITFMLYENGVNPNLWSNSAAPVNTVSPVLRISTSF